MNVGKVFSYNYMNYQQKDVDKKNFCKTIFNKTKREKKTGQQDNRSTIVRYMLNGERKRERKRKRKRKREREC